MKPKYEALGGNAYVFPVAALLHLRDTEENPTRSPAVVCEDGKPLGPPHSMISDIQKFGAGRFVHYGSGVIFSASNNSDPERNGRSYWIVVPPNAR